MLDRPPCAIPGECLQPVLPFVQVGSPWALTITYDPDIAPFRAFPNNVSFWYSGIESAVLEIGGTVLTANLTTDFFTMVTTNYYFPLGVPTGGGFVQFHFAWGWRDQDGTSQLPGVLVAGWYDENALDGTLPTFPQLADDQGSWKTLEFSAIPNGGGPAFVSNFRPELVEDPTPVPEPASLLMLGAGVGALAMRRFKACRKDDVSPRQQRRDDRT